MNDSVTVIPPGYSYPATAAWFITGAAVTAIFSGSLAPLTANVELREVLLVGMVVPSFTWVVQLTASAIGLSAARRRYYWGDLGRVCLLGSIALLPAAAMNLTLPRAPLGLSAMNVLVSVAIMAIGLFRQSARHHIPRGWPISWCLTITVNMLLFLGSSWDWWQTPLVP